MAKHASPRVNKVNQDRSMKQMCLLLRDSKPETAAFKSISLSFLEVKSLRGPRLGKTAALIEWKDNHDRRM